MKTAASMRVKVTATGPRHMLDFRLPADIAHVLELGVLQAETNPD